MPTPSKRTLGERLREVRDDLLVEFVVLLGFLLTLYLSEKVVVLLFKDALIFGRYPKEFLFDAGDVALIVCFTIRSCQRILR